jgi:hypothetical protein
MGVFGAVEVLLLPFDGVCKISTIAVVNENLSTYSDILTNLPFP